MTAIVEARRLTGADLGKTIEGTNSQGNQFEGSIQRLEQCWAAVRIQIYNTQNEAAEFHSVAPHDPVTITGVTP